MTQDVLTRKFAQKRFLQVGGVSYKINIFLKKNSKTYRGKCEMNFILKKSDDLKIDFIGGAKKVLANSKESKFRKDEFSIIIPKNELVKGENSVVIEYENNYDSTGTGLHHFVDPEDKGEYLYTQFEPYDAHRLFPCFDQPDIKAKYKLTVAAPKEWTIISNVLEGKIEEKGEEKIFYFKQTPKFSTYLFHMSAGEFQIFSDKSGNIPLRVFCRQSLKKYFREEIFTFTKQGLEFYQKFFNYIYPFEKYDQIFVPEFNHGAMENVGAVTFSERFLFRYEPRRTERSGLADVILHEMVHMWFGDLVTMKWWDDLWLNESFADFLSYLGLVRATEFRDGWQSFYARKAWAYVEDQWITTHPVAADAADTDAAFSNFDGISYSKGAAVLKQLMFFIGEEAFRKGLSIYFKKYKWSNTRLKDFLGCMEEASREKLDSWAKMWLKTTGVNAIEPILKVKEGYLESFQIKQYPSLENNLLREHRCQIAFFKDGEKLKELSIKYNKKLAEVPEIINLEKPDLICLNYNDYDYVKERMDQQSLNYALQNIDEMQDNLARQMVYGALWQMVRDALLDPKKYLDLIMEKSPGEKNLFILESMFSRVAAILGYYVKDEDYSSYSEEFYNLAWKELNKKTDRQIRDVWFNLLASSIGGCENPERIAWLLEGKVKIEGFEPNQEQRWAAISRLAVFGHPEVDRLIKAELKRDPTDKGEKEAFAAKVAKPDNKKEHWNLFVKGEGYSLDYLRTGMGRFFSKKQKENLREFIDLFFKEILGIFKNKNRKYAEDFFDLLFPGVYVEKQMAEKIKGFLKKNKEMPKLLEESLLESLDELERALKVLDSYPK